MTTAQPSRHRYLWAADREATWILADKLVEDRYQVISPQLWLDTKPDTPPEVPFPLPSQALPYAHLYGYKLHLPQVYGFCSLKRSGLAIEVPLLENIPVDHEGKLLPSLNEAWPYASALYQTYWLWQIINLWPPLAGTGVLSSLIVPENIRVDGWRIRLCELIPDDLQSHQKVTVAKLGKLWQQHYLTAHMAIADTLQTLIVKMQAEKVSLRDVNYVLNRMLLQQAAQLPLRCEISGGTDVGSSHGHNEDSYYPQPIDLIQDPTPPQVAIVCDGVAGHEGGEVASQLAVKMLCIQAQALIDDTIHDREVIPPDQVYNSIAAILRVVNNAITAQNDEQGRESRRRMGTTCVLAIQVPQPVATPKGKGNSHEIYIAHVGDSRAYWITRDRCQLLTIDDDVATREIKQGRDVYWRALNRADASSLTQALGTKLGEVLVPNVQRFMVIEDGILLLCSDGLSDRQVVESSWREYAHNILDARMSLSEAVQSWLALASQKNGDDNISLVLMSCRVSAPNLGGTIVPVPSNYRIPTEGVAPSPRGKSVVGKLLRPLIAIGVLLGLLGSGMIGLSIVRPELVAKWREQLLPSAPQPRIGNRGE
jgi:protein phosphatase